MKTKLTKAMAAICLMLVIPMMGFGQYTVINDQFYSQALSADNMVDVWLPPGYYENPQPYYPVIYLLHSAVDHTGNLNNQNGYENFLPILNQMTDEGEIDHFIIVKPNGWAPPYAGSGWYNSPLYGNFEDMVRLDLISYIETNYRVLKGQDYRYIMGHSMGAHAGWSMSIRFPELFGAVADIAGYKNMGMTTQLLTPTFLAENGGSPPYSYSPANGQLSALVFTLLGAYNANMTNPPFYVNMFLDPDGNIIPEYYDDWLSDDIYKMIPTATKPSNTKYWIAQSATDNVNPYPTVVQFMNRLDTYNWDYDFFTFEGGHFLIDPAMEEAFKFIDGVWKTKEAPMDYNILIEDIEFQPGVSIDININVYVNENATNWANHGKIFAIEGMAHTANCWKPFAEELFINGPQGAHLNEFFAIDMPGRGGSGLPEGLNEFEQPFLLDQMYIEDYVVVIQGAIEYLIEEMDIQPNTIMGHSLGGLEVIMLQDKLIDEGSNLRKKYKIKNAVLLAPAPPAPIDWAFISGGGGSALLNYVAYIPGRGTMLDLVTPPNCYAWPYIFFTNTCCYFPPNMVPGAPTPPEVIANGYNAMEPGPLCLQIGGMEIPPGLPYPYKPRVEANPNIFKAKHGVQLSIVSDEYDKMMTPAEEMALYEYLTGDSKHKRLFEVKGDETCHDTHISDPHAIVELLNKPSIFKNSALQATENTAQDFTVYPNPISSQLELSFSLESDQLTKIEIIDALGKVSRILVNKVMPEGNHILSSNLGDLPEGVYFCRLQTGDKTISKKIIKVN